MNAGLTRYIADYIKKQNKKISIVLPSSIHVNLENNYGKSKKKAEDILIEYSRSLTVPICIFRLAYVFGKWSRPYHSSVVATFCYNISHGKEIWISDKEKEINLIYIENVISIFTELLGQNLDYAKYYYDIDEIFKITLGDLSNRLYIIYSMRNNSLTPDLSDKLSQYLYATYASFEDRNVFL